MDINSETILGESSQSSTLVHIYDSLAVNNSSLHVLPVTCAICQKILSSHNDTGDLEAISICGDCKLLLLEDLEINSLDVFRRRMPLSRRRRYGSSESLESIFSQQFSQMITLARQTQSTALEHDNQSVDGDGTARLVQRASSHTTPSGSRRWRRVFSDTESDGFDSLYGESESNISSRRYRFFHGEADTISFSAYGGDSDASVDGQSFLENENFGHPDGGSDLESDTDIDPMNAGLYQWYSEDQEEEDEDDSEWEEADIEGNTVESLRAEAVLHGSLGSNGSNIYSNWPRQLLPPEVEGEFPLRIRETTQAHSAELLTNFAELEAQNYVGDSGEYLDARGFENMLEHLAETESSRRGAPPAAISFINSMPLVTINEVLEKLDSLACAICKDSITLGAAVNQLPCSHLYHPSCILPWLLARNTCPLCRYELPTDDKDYEERKRNRGNGFETLHIHQHVVNEDSSLYATYDVVEDEPSQRYHGREQRERVNADSVREIPRNRWFFLAAAAAPIVSMVGISLMLWFGKPSAVRRWPSGRIPYRRENTQRRWWSFF